MVIIHVIKATQRMRINSDGWNDEVQFWISVKIRRNQKVTVNLAQNFARGTINWVWTDIKQEPGRVKLLRLIKIQFYVKLLIIDRD